MKRTLLLVILTAALLNAGSFIYTASAQISIISLPGGSYSQTFDSLANSGADNPWVDNTTLTGWYAWTNNPTAVALTYAASTGTGTKAQMYSCGASGSTERALGSIASSTSSALAYGVRFVNDTGSDISSITITYTGEQWRKIGSSAEQPLAFSYRVSATPITNPEPGATDSWTPFTDLNFVTPNVGGTTGALDGNAPANRQVFAGVLLNGVAVPAGSEIFLRWRDIDDSGTDHAVAIDDLMVNFSGGTISTSAPTYALVSPLAQTNKAGTTVTLTATSDGSPSISLSYQWRKNGIPLSNTGNISGATTPTLILTGVLAGNAGSYDVIVANSAGSATSPAATLTVVDPAIQSQSANQARLGGESVTFTVTAKGTPPLTYQWFFGGTPIAGATGSALSLYNLKAPDQGSYTCRVTNSLGAGVASAPINLTVTVLPGVTLALWDFNDTNAPFGSPPPIIGTGTAILLNGVTATFAAGAASDHTLTGTNQAWNTTTYPAQGTDNKLAGVQFNVSTLGHQNIYLSWSQRHSNSGSKYTRLQYTTDGTTFTDLDFNTMTNGEVFVPLSRELSAIPEVNNNPAFAFRIVSEFESLANPSYVGTAGSYTPGGTLRFDLVRVYADPLGSSTPAPTSINSINGSTLTYGGGGGSRFVLLHSPDADAPLSSWTRVATNSATPGSFSVPTGSGQAAFYRIKSE
ncbi:MAG TPA: immunoglobulin domain-containing protein [Candidatus Paceibacterota bacterium]|nr:immunoglobulin domain-containing protein [Verrucomicrobiota bacterium]HSA10757.1 immunoglobulin domain-containing protein [Candidatus Paceibacterota bacterium]